MSCHTSSQFLSYHISNQIISDHSISKFYIHWHHLIFVYIFLYPLVVISSINLSRQGTAAWMKLRASAGGKPQTAGVGDLKGRPRFLTNHRLKDEQKIWVKIWVKIHWNDSDLLVFYLWMRFFERKMWIFRSCLILWVGLSFSEVLPLQFHLYSLYFRTFDEPHALTEEGGQIERLAGFTLCSVQQYQWSTVRPVRDCPVLDQFLDEFGAFSWDKVETKRTGTFWYPLTVWAKPGVVCKKKPRSACFARAWYLV